MTFFTIWYLSGLASVIWGESRLDDFTVRELYGALIVALGGFITVIYQISYNTDIMNFVLVRRRKK